MAEINNELSNQTINSLVILGASIFAGTDSGIYKSVNNGLNWTPVNNGFPYSTPPVINSLSTYDKKLYASTIIGLYVSNDLGVIWKKIDIAEDDSGIYSFTNEKESSFVLSANALSVSVDDGENWSQIDTKGMTSTDIRSICINGPFIFAGINRGGMYKRSLLISANDETSCTGASVDLNAQQTIGDATNARISWSTGETANSITVNPTVTTTYNVYAVNNTLTDTSQVTITVKPLPQVVVDSSTICKGDSVVLTAKGARSYFWDTGDINNWIIAKPSASTKYMVIGTVEGIGCIDTTFTSVKVNPIPETPIIDLISDTLISSAKIGNQWYKDNYYIWEATDSSYIYSQNGNYHTIVTLHGCSSEISNIINITSVGVNDNPSISDIRIFPNPVTDYLHIESTNELTIHIANLNGQILQSIKNKSHRLNIDLSLLPCGTYLMKIETKNKNITRKFIKQ